ncbi:hypothetical protein Tco_0857685 [Tanacetum coccineum]|uniref:Uncharacterized protein n=1 Tax=Tanacetum coccineum TaxID=301880 RepID=A0ABQ5B805_9ASTR
MAARVRHASLDFSYGHAPRSGVEEEQKIHLLSHTAGHLLPNRLDLETTSHLLFSCSLARQVRIKVNRWWELADHVIHSYEE